jgi:glycosidase
MEFHVSRASRDRYQFDDALFSLTGNAVIADFYAARVFAQRMIESGRPAAASEINAMGLIDEIGHMLIAEYRRQVNPQALGDALASITAALGAEAIDAALLQFAQEFPTVEVYRGRKLPTDYLDDRTDGVHNREVLLEEMMMLWLANMNPAFGKYDELFSDEFLKQGTAYQFVIDQLVAYFDSQPPFLDNKPLISVLRAPALEHPESLEAQLQYVEQRWLSGAPGLRRYVVRSLSSRDFIKEEQRTLSAFFSAGFQGMGAPGFSQDEIRQSVRAGWAAGDGGRANPPGGTTLADYAAGDVEYEAYTTDRAWMPRLVLMAKNAYVWLDQLSKQYGREIARLDQVPDEELDKLQQWGITGLWLIGLWERSRASKRIKQMMGADDAVASAYSLMDYRIADDLGGDGAMNNLRERAWRRGIRMGSDMVPNHFGIDSTWVINHPDRFLALDHAPYPSYSFNGPDLSEDPRVGIFLEDHYYNRTDAAVVFKRLDRWSGEARYIYHGNDGTSMPWNDTAQLNYLKADVREAVIQTILQVCRQFPIVRFDAAMTLAKRHVQRLWFPIPGSGDGIPSRAGLGLTKDEFDRMVPQEFWREVVDRAAVEVPDTLLLAEAFWMLEGYFVRTLGMHRVYNSAFMHMMRDEDNAKYRYLIKETLEFDPQILKRYVNFMNNPDEKTAVEQFGKGDKYFGVTLLLSTLPGLPMYGHGQVEGYAEKYGMEFRRPKLNESPDHGLIDYHARMVFPILHKRYLFAEVERFFLYDFFAPDGVVDENVFAYSNEFGDEKALVLYHNRFADTRGYVRTSAAFLSKGEGLRTITLAEAFKLRNDERHFLRFRDHGTGLEFVRSSREIHERGLYVELGPYKSHIFLDVREVYDTDGSLARLNHELGGHGVTSIDTMLHEYAYEAVLVPMRALLNADTLRLLHGSRVAPESVKRGRVPAVDATFLDSIETRALALLNHAAALSLGSGDAAAIAKSVREDMADLLRLPCYDARFNGAGVGEVLGQDLESWAPVLAWALAHRLGEVAAPGRTAAAAQTLTWLTDWSLRTPLLEAFSGLGLDAGAAQYALDAACLLIAHAGALSPRDAVGAAESQQAQDAPTVPDAAEATVPPAAAAPKANDKKTKVEAVTAEDAHVAERAASSADDARALLAALLADADVRRQIKVNAWQSAEFFNKEAFESVMQQLLAVELTMLAQDRTPAETKATAAAAARVTRLVADVIARASAAGYRVDRLLAPAA